MRYPKKEEFEKAEQTADLADDMSRDSTKLIEFLTYFSTKNPRLKGHVRTRTTAVSSWGWDIKDDKKKSADDVKKKT